MVTKNFFSNDGIYDGIFGYSLNSHSGFRFRLPHHRTHQRSTDKAIKSNKIKDLVAFFLPDQSDHSRLNPIKTDRRYAMITPNGKITASFREFRELAQKLSCSARGNHRHSAPRRKPLHGRPNGRDNCAAATPQSSLQGKPASRHSNTTVTKSPRTKKHPRNSNPVAFFQGREQGP